MQRSKTLAAIFSIAMGTMMLIWWSVLLAQGQVAGLATGSPETLFLLVAEFATALALITGGLGLRKRRAWSLQVILVALGMLLYCVINSIGVFAEQRLFVAAAWFAAVAVATAVLIASLLYYGARPGESRKA